MSEDLIDKRKCRKMTREESDKAMAFLASEDPRFLEVFAPLRKDSWTVKEVWACRRFLNRYLEAWFYRLFFQHELAGWNIYKMDGVYRAVPRGFEKWVQDQLNDIAPASSDSVLVAKTYEELKLEVLKRPFYRPDLAPDQIYAHIKGEILFRLGWLVRLRRRIRSFLRI